MKRSILMVTVLAAALTAVAQQQTQTQTQSQSQIRAAQVAPMSAIVQKPAAEKKVEIFTPLSKKLPPKQTDKVERVDGLSSQPWSRMVGSRPGWSTFTDPERHDATLDVFWIGAPPTH
jgi:hypothetical protein